MLLGYSCRHESYLVSLVCTWRHGGHVSCQEQKHFSPLESKLFFHVNSSRKFFIANMAACHMVENQEYHEQIRQVTLHGFGLAPLQESRRNHRSYVWPDALSGMVPAQKLSRYVVWTHPQWCIANPAPAYKLFMKHLRWLLSKNHFH